MLKANELKTALAVFLVGAATASLPARAADPADSKSSLLHDITVYQNECRPTSTSPSCAERKAQLSQRQYDLKLSTAEVNDALQHGQMRTRGFGRGPWDPDPPK
jgi:hypothetical protein